MMGKATVVATGSGETPVVLKRMLRRRATCLPVVHARRLIGMITHHDVLRLMVHASAGA